MEFTKTELELIDEALTLRIQTMMTELVHTDDRALRDQLKHALEDLELLEKKVAARGRA